MKRHFFLPTPAKLAAEQLAEAERELLVSQADMEAFTHALDSACSRVRMLEIRVARLRKRVEEGK